VGIGTVAEGDPTWFTAAGLAVPESTNAHQHPDQIRYCASIATHLALPTLCIWVERKLRKSGMIGGVSDPGFACVTAITAWEKRDKGKKKGRSCMVSQLAFSNYFGLIQLSPTLSTQP
jgi:hypothetical protein